MIRIEHLAIWVSDLEEVKDFYVDHFGATSGKRYHNPTKSFTSYFLSFSSGSRLELMHQPGKTARTAQPLGLAHFAISLGSHQRVDELTRQMRAAGVTVVSEPRKTGDGYYESLVLDPEGNRIELTV